MDHIDSDDIQDMRFTKELKSLLNKYSLDNESNTPDFILAKFMHACYDAYNTAIHDIQLWKSI
jgi:hypothetical protein